LGGVAALLATGIVLGCLAPLSPRTYDLYLYRADRLFGYDALRVMPAFAAAGWLRIAAERVYLALPFVLAAGVGLVALERRPRALLERLLIAPMLGVLIYLIVPACGPVFVPPPAFSGPPHPLAVDPAVWRNALPSLHLTWAALLWPAWGRVRWSLGSAFVIFTAACCLGDGQHYLVDLLAAVPFTALVTWLVPER
jgi:hypothetical protein